MAASGCVRLHWPALWTRHLVNIYIYVQNNVIVHSVCVKSVQLDVFFFLFFAHCNIRFDLSSTTQVGLHAVGNLNLKAYTSSKDNLISSWSTGNWSISIAEIQSAGSWPLCHPKVEFMKPLLHWGLRKRIFFYSEGKRSRTILWCAAYRKLRNATPPGFWHVPLWHPVLPGYQRTSSDSASCFLSYRQMPVDELLSYCCLSTQE